MAEQTEDPYSARVPKKLRALVRQSPHRVSIIKVFKSLVTFSYHRELNQYFVLVLEMIHNLILLMNRPGRRWIEELHETTKAALLLETDEDEDESVPHAPLGRQQYIAVVGGLSISSAQCVDVLKKEGKLTKKNILICDDIPKFKSGAYTDSLRSDNCVAIILGPIPHSHHENLELELRDKIVYARNNSSTHGKLNLTKSSIARAIDELRKRKFI